MFRQEAINSFIEAANLVYDELSVFEQAAQKRWEALVVASPVLSLEKQREVLALCTSHLAKNRNYSKSTTVAPALEARYEDTRKGRKALNRMRKIGVAAARINPSQWDGICELVYQIVANDQPFKIPGVP